MLIALQIVAGLVLLVVGGELLVRGAASLAAAFRISPLVIGLTVVAFGTSAPELCVSLQAANSGNAGVAIGNVIGSNIINVLFVLGAAALVAPLIVNSDLVRKDVPVMIAASFAVWYMASDGTIARIEGILLFASLCIYLSYSIVTSRRANLASEKEFEDLGVALSGKKAVALQVFFLIAGLALLGVGANWLVTGATAVATSFGISDLVVGLTVVAIGTSMPEAVTSIVASYRGQRDIAVGNVVGSNLFNLLCVLGLTATFSPGGIPVSADAVAFDFPVMIAVALVCFPIFLTGYRVQRWEGALFLIYYAVYTLIVVLVAKSPELSANYGTYIWYGVIPLSIGTFVVSMLMSRRGAKD
ncbi:Inner membrane protein YrbG [Rubripirellula obstinata]|uniref:Inner membrane protein YrbG n=1 Tax=Rubripirellula obstinata TaxID=406547 RepID=A0A5B1CDX0_9BACT|nr:calcium/sodium antiporter [Rubripirellula obstinata]KAA1257790.1 Inner membrane protein YrbG [Rubripirellula obstinata]